MYNRQWKKKQQWVIGLVQKSTYYTFLVSLWSATELRTYHILSLGGHVERNSKF